MQIHTIWKFAYQIISNAMLKPIKRFSLVSYYLLFGFINYKHVKEPRHKVIDRKIYWDLNEKKKKNENLKKKLLNFFESK